MDWFDGEVLWFNDEKGFGFIVDVENPNSKYFVHYQSILTDAEWKSLKPGKKIKARNIKDSKFGPEVREVREL